MAESLASVAAHVKRKLEAVRAVAEEIEMLEEQIILAVRDLEALKQEVNGLAGRISSPLLNNMTKELKAVRRAADSVRLLVRDKRTYSPDRYYESLSKLAGFLDDELGKAVAYFTVVGERNPSALRSYEHGQAINIPIDGADDNDWQHWAG
jgi:hypothetical protein